MEGDKIKNMSVYIADTELKARESLRRHRPNSQYKTVRFQKIKQASIVKDYGSDGHNTCHYLVSGISVKEIKNIFS